MTTLDDRISSDLTFLYKWAYPTLTTGVAVVLVVAVFRDGSSSSLARAAIAVMGLLLITLPALFSRKLRSVSIRADHVVISNHGDEVLVPFEDIVEIESTIIRRPYVVRLTYRTSSGTRESVSFIAPVRWRDPFDQHPVVVELRNRINGGQQRTFG